MTPTPPSRVRVGVALFSLYFVWGSTYLGMKFALEGFPPLFLAGARYLLGGLFLFGVLRTQGGPLPTRAEWCASAGVGILLCAGNALLVVAIGLVASGLAAVVVASVPLWVALFNGFLGQWPRPREWLGLGVGFSGIVVLQWSGQLRSSATAAGVLVASTIVWSLGSTWSLRVRQAPGLIASAAQMISGGAAILIVALAVGSVPHALPGTRAMLAFGYLVVVGSMIGYSAYVYLLGHVRPALATSYAYVNPVVALALGAAIGRETVSPHAVAALALILGGVTISAVRQQ